jgi:hypothetical protein
MRTVLDGIAVDDAARQILPFATVPCDIEHREYRMSGKGGE